MQTNFVQGKITFVPCFSPMVWINNQFFPHGMNQQSIPLWFWNTSNTSYKYEQDMVARISDYEYRKCSSLEVLERPMKRECLYFIAKIILRRGRFWNFPNIYPSQRQNLLPTLEISNQNFQNFHNFQIFGKKFPKSRFFSKISNTTKGPPMTSKGPPPPY